jgi:hypothetical protein
MNKPCWCALLDGAFYGVVVMHHHNTVVKLLQGYFVIGALPGLLSGSRRRYGPSATEARSTVGFSG